MKKKYSLKDELFNQEKVEKLAQEIEEVYLSFKSSEFTKEVVEKFPTLELKERIYHIREMLHRYLPLDYKEAIEILLKALPFELDPTKSDDDFGDFIYAPYGDYVATYGCVEEHLELSLFALVEMTKRFSMEYAIRDFINSFPQETLAMLYQLSISKNYHQRRFVSEGLRPKLPWSKKLTVDYREPLKHLDNLFCDATRYVTRSVANHLNDIAKIDASLVLETLKQWKKSSKQKPKEMEFILTHSLRTLVKEGNLEALELLGYASHPKIVVSSLIIADKEVKIGKALVFGAVIEAKEDVKLMVDYLLYFRNKKGELSPKVHKLKKLKMKKGEKMIVKKRHLFRANMTTRKLYVGEHKVALQVNGERFEDVGFQLLQL